MKPETEALEENETKTSISREEFIMRIREYREQMIASGEPFLTWEQLDDELAERHRYNEEEE